jgi:uncharacterized membrane protein
MIDWKIKKFLIFVFTCQIAALGGILFEAAGFQLPFVRQFVVGTYLGIVPGLAIFRIMRVHSLKYETSIPLVFGLSVSFIMLVGLLTNRLYPLLGITEPLSVLSQTITLLFGTTILTILACVRDHNFVSHRDKNKDSITFSPILILILIPILAILGVQLVNQYSNNILIIVLILLIAFIIGSIAIKKFFPLSLYGLAIVSVSLSLLFCLSLLTPYVFGSDIALEFHLAKLTQSLSFWNPGLNVQDYSGMISVTILPTVISNLMNMDITWVFKIVYPIIFSLVPLVLYSLYRKQTNSQVACLAAFFFIAMPVFYGEMNNLMRQQIAELFLALILLVIFYKGLRGVSKSLLLIMFGFSVVISHYAISYILLFMLVGAFVTIFAIRLKRNNYNYSYVISLNIIGLLIVTSLAWYIFVSNQPFVALVNIGNHLINSIFGGSVLEKSYDLNILRLLGFQSIPGFWGNVQRFFFLITSFFMIIGFIRLAISTFKQRSNDISRLYFTFAAPAMTMLFLATVIPLVAVSWNMTRIYHVALFILSPMVVTGALTFFRWITRIMKLTSHSWLVENSLSIVSVIVIIPYYIINTGVMNEITNDIPRSLSISLTRMVDSRNADPSIGGYAAFIHKQEVISSQWLRDHFPIETDSSIYTDFMYVVGNIPLVEYGDFSQSRIKLLSPETVTSDDDYIYLGYMNVVEERIKTIKSVETNDITTIPISTINELLNIENIVYTNGASKIYR